MIMTHVIGGLGNQMFQYAAGRALAMKHGQPLYLDVSDFADYRLHHGFELARVFEATLNIASPIQRKELLGWRAGKRVQNLLRRPQLAGLRGGRLAFEPHFQHWDGFDQLPGNCYLAGYWQSEKYFEEYSAAIRTDLVFKQPMSKKNLQISEQIGLCNAVSLHVRRGDYASNPATNTTHGLCPLEYYQAAIQYVAGRIEDPHFFIFSDDIDWVRQNLKMVFPHQHVNHNHGADSYNDMRLMSLCRHHIIANSSFSWWGAWLNSNHEKMVVAPRQWFANDNDVDDLFPQDWVTL